MVERIDDPRFWKRVKTKCRKHLVEQFATPALTGHETRTTVARIEEWMNLTEEKYVSGVRVWSDRYWTHFSRYQEVWTMGLRTDFLDWLYPKAE